YLVARGAQRVVVACNSIEVAAIEEVGVAAGVPVVGVIDTRVGAAVLVTHNRRIGKIGTEATVKSGAYDRAVARTGKDVELFCEACPVFVEFVERGDTSSPQLFAAAREYLAPLQAANVDT